MQTEVRESLAIDNPWKPLKQFGFAAFKDQAKMARELLDTLAGLGIVLVEVGELEGFGQELGVSKGSGWVHAALEADVHKSSEAKTLASTILKSVASVRAS